MNQELPDNLPAPATENSVVTYPKEFERILDTFLCWLVVSGGYKMGILPFSSLQVPDEEPDMHVYGVMPAYQAMQQGKDDEDSQEILKDWMAGISECPILFFKEINPIGGDIRTPWINPFRNSQVDFLNQLYQFTNHEICMLYFKNGQDRDGNFFVTFEDGNFRISPIAPPSINDHMVQGVVQ